MGYLNGTYTLVASPPLQPAKPLTKVLKLLPRFPFVLVINPHGLVLRRTTWHALGAHVRHVFLFGPRLLHVGLQHSGVFADDVIPVVVRGKHGG